MVEIKEIKSKKKVIYVKCKISFVYLIDAIYNIAKRLSVDVFYLVAFLITELFLFSLNCLNYSFFCFCFVSYEDLLNARYKKDLLAHLIARGADDRSQTFGSCLRMHDLKKQEG